MTTHIVLAGLMLLVPGVDPETNRPMLTALVLDTEHQAAQFGHPLQVHETTIRNYNGAEKPLRGAWTFDSSGGGGLKFEQDDRMLVLRRVYGGARLPDVRKACLGDNFAVDCRIEDRPLLVAQLRFIGEWRVRPIDINKPRDPTTLRDDSWWGYLRQEAGALPVALKGKVQLSAGVMLDAPDGATVSIGGPADAASFATLKTVKAADCGSMTGDERECAIVRIINTGMPMAPRGEGLEIDHHHSLIYDLFFPSPSPRYLVFLRADGSDEVMRKLYPSQGGTIDIRPCPPPALLTIPGMFP